MTKKLGVIIGIILITILLFTTNNYAVSDVNGIYLGLKGRTTERETGRYTFNSKDIFKIVKYNNSTGTTEVGDNASIYCVKAGPGFGSESYQNTIVNYTQYFDMKNPDAIESPYRESLPTDMTTYNELIWVLDHLYIPAKTGATSDEIALANESKQNLLDNAGVSEDSFLRDSATYGQEIEDILECIQQVAIWYFTNPDGEYHNDSTETVEIAVDGESLIDKYGLDIVENEIDAIYHYLVQGAIDAVNGGYTYEDSIIGTSPITFIKNQATLTMDNSNYILGPYRIEEQSNGEYNLSAELYSSTGTISNAKVLDENRQEITTGSNLTEKIQTTIGNNFYISIPISSNITDATLAVNAEYYNTTQTLWTVGQASLANNQPVVIISRDKQNYRDAATIQITNPEFDLALRKFITSINGSPVEVSREPQITQEDLRALATGTADFDNGTTVTKTHTKTPLVVDKDDRIIYTIRIYNEGDIDGYADAIIDYLPAGLELVDASESTINTKYGWTEYAPEPVSTDGSTTSRQAVTTDYLKDTVISAFDKDPDNGVYTIDYVDVQIECRVTKDVAEQDVSLKNVAEILEAHDITGGRVDRDSKTGNLTNNEINNYLPGTSEEGKGYQDDDDYEELVMLGKYFDLSLRKFITAINDREITNREPEVDVNPLLSGETTATYNHTKNPVSVEAGDIVTYTIRVYNEGQVDGYVDEIVEHLPPYLEFIVNDDLNAEYGWIIDTSDETQRTLRTSILSRENDVENVIPAFDSNTNSLSYKEVKIRCRVVNTAPTLTNITNIAEITKYSNESNLIDRDNARDVVLPSDEELPNYKNEEINSGIAYIPGQEDDDDFEKVILQKFDLALRKFITGVNDEEITNRVPEVDTSLYGTTDEEGNLITNFTYNHTKDPVRVCQNDIVIYTIRIYNEGTMSGYAEEIKDDVPEGLIFLPENEVNQEYRWVMYDANGNVTENAEEAAYIRTDYLSKAQEETEGENLLQAYDAETMEGPDYRDVRVAFRVTEPNTSDRIIINRAEISDDSDSDGEDVTDIDSTPDEWIDGEDDQDIEKIYVQYFDLALRKWVSQVILIEDGVEKVKDTGHYAEQDPEPVVRVDLNQDRIDNTIIKFRYQIRITNEGEIPGYATEISDYIPEGLEFNQADNPGWREVDGKVVTDALKDTLLEPGESAVVEIVLTWINDEENMGVMINTAEISEDYNESETPDIDSTPNNKVEGEDDIDDAPVALTMVTGSTPLYIGITAGTLAIIAGGVFLIKRYVI